MKPWASLFVLTAGVVLAGGVGDSADASRRPGLGVPGSGSTRPSAPPPSPRVSSPRPSTGGVVQRSQAGSAATQRNRRPRLFQDGVRPPSPSPGPGPKPPPSNGGGDDRWRRNYYRYYRYHDPFYDPFYGGSTYGYGYGYGYGRSPYDDRYGSDEYYDRFGRRRVRDEEEEVDRRGNVALRVEPRDVQVYVDGVLTTRDGRAAINLPTGRWRLEFVRPGYRTESVDLEVQQGVTYRVERRLERLRDADRETVEFPLTDTGELRLDIQPGDATVYLDGRAIGLARDLRDAPFLRRLAPGRHVVEVRRPGYATLRREVVVSPVTPAVVREELREESR